MGAKVSAVQVRTGPKWKKAQTPDTVPVAGATALSRTKQIIKNEKGVWFEWLYNTCNSKLPLCEGLGGFPDNPPKPRNNKQDWQPKQKYHAWFEAAE